MKKKKNNFSNEFSRLFNPTFNHEYVAFNPFCKKLYKRIYLKITAKELSENKNNFRQSKKNWMEFNKITSYQTIKGRLSNESEKRSASYSVSEWYTSCRQEKRIEKPILNQKIQESVAFSPDWQRCIYLKFTAKEFGKNKNSFPQSK